MKQLYRLLCFGSLTFALTTMAWAGPRKLPPKNPVTVEVGHTIHGISRFPTYLFVLVGDSVPFRRVLLTKEGQRLPSMKYGGMLFAVPKKAWKEHFVKKKRKRMITAKHLKALYFPRYANSIHSQLVLQPGSPATLVQVKLVVKKVRKEAKRIVLAIETTKLDRNGKRIKARPAPPKKRK